ncbi:MAG: outer membrane beta-barrel protein [Tardiphaga sp.]
MRNTKFLAAAGVAVLLSMSPVFAADLPMRPSLPYAPPAPPEDPSGWYLRGDIGFSNQRFDKLSINNPTLNAGIVPGTFSQTSSVDTGGIFDVGVGYQFNNWFRGDVIGQYRGKAGLKAVDLFSTPVGGGVTTPVVDTYAGSKSELLFLANAYVDLGTWWGVTPFIGAGVGTSRVTISNFADVSLISPTYGGPGVAYAQEGSKWNFAWAAHAGLAFKVDPRLTLELGYSYVDLGSGVTGRAATYDQPLSPYVFNFDHITSHDLKLGLRWNLDCPPPYAPLPPLVRKG